MRNTSSYTLTRIFCVLLFIGSVLQGYGQIKSPEAYFYLPFGKQFIPHHEMIRYFEEAAAKQDNIVLNEYGRTNEGRPLINIILSDPTNMNQLETIRQKHVGDLGFGDKNGNDKAIIYLSFNVHGNEASGVNAAIKTLHQLANPTPAIRNLLKEAIIIIDPCVNPDGYARYVNWYHEVASKQVDANPNTREHLEPWPGGRTNHYYFDLNRDWAWQIQAESKQRMKFYLEWMPHIHSDYHEQHYLEPYYFAPAAKPMHELVTEHQKKFQTLIGKNNASHFDQQGWAYFTKEVFDLLYPSYGDTYPTFCGAIGMTFEQGGSGRAGRSIELPHNDSLTLADRIEHHVTTAISTIEVAVEHKNTLLEEQKGFFKKAKNGDIEGYQHYIIKTNAYPQASLLEFLELMDANKIVYQFADKGQSITAFSYRTKEQTTVNLDNTDIVISTSQPQGHLVKAILDPSPTLEDSLTYDITAWSLMYAYDFDAYASSKNVKTTDQQNLDAQGMHVIPSKTPYAILAKWESWHSAGLLAAWQEAGIFVRSSREPFTSEGQHFDRGTLLILAADNKNVKDFAKKAISIANARKHKIFPAATGWVEKGKDFGSETMKLLPKAKILVLGGKHTDPYSYGRIWHFFDVRMEQTVSYAEWDKLGKLDLSQYNTIVITKTQHIENAAKNELMPWVAAGGRLVLINQAIDLFKSEFQLSSREKDSIGTPKTYADRERHAIGNAIFGAIVPIQIDNTHPLGFGLEKQYPSLKTNDLLLEPLTDGWNVGMVKKGEPLAGFVGANIKKAIKNSLGVGEMSYRKGSVVVLVDDPLFRGFWNKGMLLFSNAVYQR